MTEENDTTLADHQDDPQAERGQFTVQKIYVKDISFEVPDSPVVFKKKWEPVVDMDVDNTAEALGDDLYDVVLSITVVVKLQSEVAYLIEVRQAGIFLIRDLPDVVQDRVLATSCANILLPFAREVISDLVTHAGFPQFLIQPINFDALYEQRLKQDTARTRAGQNGRERTPGSNGPQHH